MKVVIYVSPKGGAGKTTMTAHFSVSLANADVGPVAVMDLDPQGTLADWWNARKAAIPLFAKPASARAASVKDKVDQLAGQGVEWVVIDTAPTTIVDAELLKLADLVVVPLQASPLDVKSIQKSLIPALVAVGVPYAFLVNAVKTRSSLAVQTVTGLSSVGRVAPVLIGHREAYKASMTDGRVLQEVYRTGEGAEEQALLLDFILRALGARQDAEPEKAHV